MDFIVILNKKNPGRERSKTCQGKIPEKAIKPGIVIN